jgi:hypothetical protein
MFTKNPAAVAAAALMFACAAHARGDMYPDSFISAQAGSSKSTFSDDTYDYPDFTGEGSGASARFAADNGLMFDAKYQYSMTRSRGEDFKQTQIDGGIGYLGHLGRHSSWYLEGVVAQAKLNDCFIDCVSATRTGYGGKVGFVWPFARQWYGALQIGYLSFESKNGSGALDQGVFGGSIGYKINPHLGLALGAEGVSYVDRHDSNYTIAVANYFGSISFYF